MRRIGLFPLHIRAARTGLQVGKRSPRATLSVKRGQIQVLTCTTSSGSLGPVTFLESSHKHQNKAMLGGNSLPAAPLLPASTPSHTPTCPSCLPPTLSPQLQALTPRRYCLTGHKVPPHLSPNAQAPQPCCQQPDSPVWGHGTHASSNLQASSTAEEKRKSASQQRGPHQAHRTQHLMIEFPRGPLDCSLPPLWRGI
jgi:hypothetical protein